MDDRNVEVPGAVPVERVLANDPIYRVLSDGLASPWMLGATIAAIVILAIVFGPSADSHFIYTDF